MSDLFRVTTPIVPRSYVNPNTKAAQQQDATSGFNLVDLSKVIKSNTQEEFQNPNMQLSQKQALAEKFFFNLIKDPSLAASSLKAFFEAYGNLSAADISSVKDINVENFVQLSKVLGLDYNGLMNEMKVQSDGISLFKGEFFDLIRKIYSDLQSDNTKGEIIKNNNTKGEIVKNDNTKGDVIRNDNTKGEIVKNDSTKSDVIRNDGTKGESVKNLIVALLKSVSTNHANNDVYGSLIENVKSLLNDLPPQSLFAIKSQTIINSMRFINPNSPNWKSDFEGLKNQIVTLLKEINISPFNTNKIENSSALIIYNLSFLNSSGGDTKEILAKLLARINDPKMAEDLQLTFNRFMAMRSDPSISSPKTSELIDSIANFVKIFQRTGKGQLTDNPEINNILRSLIAAPNSFTPLLHFILPLKHNDVQAFAELWIDPYEEGGGDASDNKLIHLFLVIDVVQAGYFELEMTLRNNDLSLLVLCPEADVAKYAPLKNDIALAVASTPYNLSSIMIDKLIKPRKLTQVFPKLMQKRDGFDVKA